jgi:hypothetical protein
MGKDGNGYKIPANPRILDPLDADLGLGLYLQTRERVRLYTQRVFYNRFENLISEPKNLQTR